MGITVTFIDQFAPFLRFKDGDRIICEITSIPVSLIHEARRRHGNSISQRQAAQVAALFRVGGATISIIR